MCRSLYVSLTQEFFSTCLFSNAQSGPRGAMETTRSQTTDAQQSLLQRVAQRRQQLEAKLRSKRSAGVVTNLSKSDGSESTGQLGRGEEQVRASRRELNGLKAGAADAVTRFRVSTDADENERRLRQEGVVADRMERITEDARTSKKSHGAIQMCFDHLHEHSVPQQLFKELNHQKEQCRRVIEVKDKLISELRLQLREKEEDYVKSLKKQAEDIDRLIDTMHTQTDTVAAAYHRELDAIEAAYAQERKELLDANAAKINEVVQEREAEESTLHKDRALKVWADQKTLDDEFEANAEKFNKLKMDMQHEIHGLSQELEKLRARYILNMEKLNYNLQVLRERCKENKKAIELHRRKIGRLLEIQSNLIAKYSDTDKKFRHVNTELTEAYRRVTEQYKDLQLKFQHFEKADADKHDQVWRMHESDNMKLVHKCLQGDRVIFEELLGVAWAPPPIDFWANAGGGLGVGASAAGGTAGGSGALNVAASGAFGASGGDPEATAGSQGGAGAEEPIELGEAGEAVLQLLYSQMPFLVEERVRKAIDELGDVEAANMKVDTLLKILNIRQTSDVQRMVECFVTTTEDGTQQTLISPQEAILALQRFMQDRQASRSKQQLDLSGVSETAAASKKAAAPSKADLAHQRRKQEREFWDRMSSVVTPGHLRIWTAVEKGLDKYLKQLQMRQKLIDETDDIRKQNDELRALLNQYLSSRLNDELFSPPQLQVVGRQSTGNAAS